MPGMLVGSAATTREAGRDVAVRVRTAVPARRPEDRPSGGRRLREPDRLRDRRLDDVELVGLRDVVEHGARVVGAPVVQRRQHTPDLEAAVGEAAYIVDG